MKYRYTLYFLTLLIVIFIISFVVGRYPISVSVILKVFLSKVLPISKTWSNTTETVIFSVRLPRIIAAMLVGASLSVSGVVYQGMFKNPLVSPDILGVSAGSAFGAALAIFLSFDPAIIQLFAFLFGLLGVIFVYLMSTRIRDDPVMSLVIIGVVVSSLFTSLTSFIKYVADANDKLPTITFWLMGSISSVTLRDIKTIILPILFGIIPLYFLRWELNVLTLGEDEAKTIGLDTSLIRKIVIICSTLMTAVSVSVSGIIGWIGLVIPHLSRMVVGPDYRVLLPVTILLGSSYLLLIDNIARTLTTVEIPLGILTSLIGAPFFIILLFNKKGDKNVRS